jgi:hypothetical protein
VLEFPFPDGSEHSVARPATRRPARKTFPRETLALFAHSDTCGPLHSTIPKSLTTVVAHG